MIDLSLKDQERTTPTPLRLHKEVIYIYIETTIPSFYYEIRQAPDMVARRLKTREWWDHHGVKYRLVTSEYVIRELENGNYPSKAAALKMMAGLTRWNAPTDDIFSIVQVYLESQLMPGGDSGDAWHLAFASYHRCHYLLTWNCQNLANPNKFERIRKINASLGLSVPKIVTPADLLKEARNV